MSTRLARRIVVLLLLGLCLPGCGGGAVKYSGPKRVAVRGKVTFDGEPVHRGTIVLIPHDDSHARVGGVIENGEYSLIEAQGPNLGEYAVDIRWPRPTGKKVPDADAGELVDELANVIPVKYNDGSELKIDTRLGDGTFDFALTK